MSNFDFLKYILFDEQLMNQWKNMLIFVVMMHLPPAIPQFALKRKHQAGVASVAQAAPVAIRVRHLVVCIISFVFIVLSS